MLGEYVQLEREVTESQTSEKKRKLDKERALVKDGKRIRDSAMGVFSKPVVTKSKGSPSSDLATALTIFLQHKMSGRNSLSTPTKKVSIASVPTTMECLTSAGIPFTHSTFYEEKLRNRGYDNTRMLKYGTEQKFQAAGLLEAHAAALADFVSQIDF